MIKISDLYHHDLNLPTLALRTRELHARNDDDDDEH